MSEQDRILYVDDDEAALESTAQYIENAGADLTVVTESDPEVALDRLEDVDPDCFVADYRMPEMDGMELLSAVREEYDSLPFVFYTAHGSEQVASRAIANGASDYLRKTGKEDVLDLLVSRIENAISQYHERLSYRELFDKTGVGIAVCDVEEYDFVEVNPTLSCLLEYDRETLLAMDFGDLTADLPAYSPGEIERTFETAVESGSEDFEWPLESADGETIWCDISLDVGEIRGQRRLLVTVRDITERKAHEREIARQNDLFSHAQRMANVGVWESDLRHDEGWWSEEVSRIYGLPPAYDPEEGEGIEFFHPEDRPELEEAYNRAVEEGEPYELELRLTDANDTDKWVRLQGEPHVVDGEVVRVRGTIQDVTERKEREQRLREIKERLDLAVEGANLGVWDWKIETGAVTINQQWADIVGMDLESMDPTIETWRNAIHPEDKESVESAIEAHDAGDVDLYNFEYRVQTANSGWKWVQTIGRIVERDDDGTPKRAVGIHMDIDERKAYEKQLKQQRDNLETLNEMVRHDIRNDLQLVLTHLEILETEIDDDEIVEHIETALESADTAIDLTKTARELAEAMLEADTELQPVDITDSLRRQLADIRSAEENVLVQTAGFSQRTDVLANEMLDSVFRNLLQNAVQHNDKEVPEVTVTMTEHPGTVEVRVADNGPGIPDEQKYNIFQKGERGSESAGSGIGLYLVETLVDQYDGSVWVEDNEPDGAIFCVELERAN